MKNNMPDTPTKRKRLWDSSKENSNDHLSTVASVRSLYASRPPHIPFFTLCCNTLVVVQEFSLTCYVLARHRLVWLQQEQTTNQQALRFFHVEVSNLILLVALLVAVAYGNTQQRQQTQDRRTKICQRLFDSLLLAFVIRFASSFLQSLTASYSSDTVQHLAVLGMLWHVLACDYAYANGIVTIPSSSARSRPSFGGGTLALNAALFSTTLLVSRVHDDNQTVFLFISLSVVVFAFYSTTRHEMARTHPAHSSVAPWIITVLVIVATLCLIWDDCRIAMAFLFWNMALGAIFPAWKYSLQSFQVLIKGPWDITQISQC